MIKKNYVSGVEFFITINIPSLWIDYNVTPDKRTIFILNETELLKSLIELCETIIRKRLLIVTRNPEVSNDSCGLNEAKTSGQCNTTSVESCCWDETLLDIGSANSVQLLKQDILQLVPIGQFNNGFIICSKPSDGFVELFAVDQHAADERIRFEEIASCYHISCQKLVQPLKIKIDLEDEDFISNNIEDIKQTGFLLRESNGEYFLDGLPIFHGAESSLEGKLFFKDF